MRFAATRIPGLMLAIVLTANIGHGQAPSTLEYQVKAAFLYHFAEFVEWPAASFPDATSPLFFGVLGEDSFRAELEKTLKNKSINKRPLKVRPIGSPQEATNSCHLLFISSTENHRVKEIAEALRNAGTSVLTIGDEVDRFTDTGVMISFVMQDQKLRFKINDVAAKHVKLKISSKLLNLASRPAR